MSNIYYEHGEGISWRWRELLEYLSARVGLWHFVMGSLATFALAVETP
jgi:hypothetical protein